MVSNPDSHWGKILPSEVYGTGILFYIVAKKQCPEQWPFGTYTEVKPDLDP
jgi:hypothetical protein